MSVDDERVKRVKRATEEYRRILLDGTAAGTFPSYEETVRRILEAADREPDPVWPSDESVRAYCRSVALPVDHDEPGGEYFERCRDALRVAMLQDPIIRAVGEWYRCYVAPEGAGVENLRALSRCHLRKAVEASGLTPEDLT